MRIALAFRAFFKALFDSQFATQLSPLLQSGAPPKLSAPATESKPQQPVDKKPARSDALTLLAALQREARFVDMIQEPLGDYNDAQVGAAARDVLRDCQQVVDRLFGLAPLVEQPEGSEFQVPEGYDAGSVRLTGNVSGTPPYTGRLVHHGWRATRCEIPKWTGSDASRLVVAPQEVELS